MFIERQCHPNIEFDPSAGRHEPTLSFFFSTIAEPLKSTLPLLIGGEGERVLAVSSPLSELVDDTIRVYRHDGFPGRAVVDQQHRAFFEAVKASLAQVMAKIDGLQYATFDYEEGEED